MLKASKAEFLNNFVDEEAKLLKIGQAHCNELSRLFYRRVYLDPKGYKMLTF